MDLNLSQQQAVQHGEGPLIIIAGAGTGKTTVITERYLHLLKKFHLKTENILCLTFTEKGTKEMADRIEKKLTGSHDVLWIHTFHAFADRILRMHGHHIGISRDVRLLNGGEQFLFMKKYFDEFKLDILKPISKPTDNIRTLLKFFDTCKREHITTEKYEAGLKKAEEDLEATRYEKVGDEYEARLIELQEQREALEAYKTYNMLLRRENCWDYGDMIVYLYKLLSERKDVLVEFQKQFRFILVDEFQDTNTLQNDVIKLLTICAFRPANITVVGDDDQSIYRFQGASVKNILEFTKTYENVTEVVLTDNYRSTQSILDASYSLVQGNNPDRLEVQQKINKKLQSHSENEGGKPLLMETLTVAEESLAIVEKIQNMVAEGAYNYSDIAVLYRNHDHNSSIVEAFRQHHIPFYVVEGSGLYQRHEVRDLLAFMRAIVDPQDSISLFRVMTLKYFKLDPILLLRISNYANSNHKSIIDVLEEDFDGLFAKAERNEEGTLFAQFQNPQEELLRNFLDTFQALLKLQFQKSASSMIEIILEKTGWLMELNEEKNLEDQQERANILKVLHRALHFEYQHEEIFLKDFVDYMNDLMEGGENPEQAQFEENENAVKLMTVHKSKGLEWPVVFTIHLSYMKFPSTNRSDGIQILDTLGQGKADKDTHYQEERRLLYVAMTRAKEQLFLSYPKSYKEGSETKPSMFIAELLSSNLVEKARAVPSLILEVSHGETEVPKNLKMAAKMSLPVLNKSYNLNFSGVKAYQDCPLKFKYLNIIQIPRPQVSAPQFGSFIHDVLEQFYRRYKDGEEVNVDTLLDYYRSHWKKTGYVSRDQEQNYFDKGLEILHSYWEVNKNSLTKPLFLEKGFKVKIGEYYTSGFIDRIDRIRDDEVEVIDYKTGNPKTQKEIQKDEMSRLQLYIYAIACQDLFNLNAVKLTYYYLDDQSKVTFVPEPEDLAWAQQIIEETGEKISESLFEGTPGRVCDYCEFEKICPSRAKK